MTVGTPEKYEEGEINKFGVCCNHEYDYIEGLILNSNDNNNKDFFFQLWNPHGSNENPESLQFSLKNQFLNIWNWWWGKDVTLPGYYGYKGFDEKNIKNKKGFDIGDIYLNLERFLYSFERFSFQNRKEVSENYAKYHKNEDILKLFGLSLLVLYFGKSLFYKRLLIYQIF